MNDQKIIQAIKEKDEKAIAMVMSKYSKLLWSVASAVLINMASEQDVEECVADVFIHLWINPEKYDPNKGKLSSWLAMVTRSKAIDRYRKLAKHQDTTLLDEQTSSGMELIDKTIAKEDAMRVMSYIDSLKEQDKEIAIRRFVYEQRVKDIALAMDIPKKNVENHLFLIKKRLKEVLQD